MEEQEYLTSDDGSVVVEAPEPQTDEADETETGEEQSLPEEVDYKAKFAASTREAQRLVGEQQRLQREREEAEAARMRSEQELMDYKRQLAEDDPELYDRVETRQKLSSLEAKLALREETEALNSFVAEIPEAASHKESLRRLYRADNSKSIADLWQENFAPLLEKSKLAIKEKQEKKKQSQPETGRDSSTSEPIKTLGAEFDKLPLEERKKIFKKMGF